MTEDLEDKAFENNISDVMLPGKMLRHVPKILDYNSKFLKAYDLFVVGAVTTAQIIAYYNLAEIISNS